MNCKFLKQAGLVFSLLFFVWILSVVAQRSLTTRDTTYYRKAVYVELAGNGISESLNYEMRLTKGRNDGIGFRAGLGLGSRYATKSSSVQYLTIPLMANYILGSGRHAVEGGIHSLLTRDPIGRTIPTLADMIIALLIRSEKVNYFKD